MPNDYVVEMKKISMIFGNIVANKDIDLNVRKGEIHAIVGENGAGKSTLMSILFGLYEPTNGEIKINGKIEVINNPIKANKLGVGMVHQHFKMVDIFPIWQNIALGDEKDVANLFINKKQIKDKITKIMEKYHLDVNLDKITSKATVGEQQRAEILKILYRDVDILVLDEPTAVLTPQEIDGLMKVMKELQKDGKTIIFISHKMAEIKEVANTVTVLRLGEVVGNFDMKTTSIEQLAEAMVGRKIVEVKNNYTKASEDVVLELKNIKYSKKHDRKSLENLNLEIRAGEIVAIAGVEGNGQQEIVDIVAGLIKPDSGQVIINGKNVTKKDVASRYLKYRVSHIPEDRQKYGLVLDSNLIENMVLQDISSSEFSSFGFINKAKVQTYAQDVIANYDVRGAESGFAIARQLSGGNQQKVVVGRELTRPHDLIIIFQPTRGLDIGSIEFIHEQILNDKKNGAAVLLVSYELSEVMSLADRIVVISSGVITGSVLGKDAKREQLGQMMMGISKGVEK